MSSPLAEAPSKAAPSWRCGLANDLGEAERNWFLTVFGLVLVFTGLASVAVGVLLVRARDPRRTYRFLLAAAGCQIPIVAFTLLMFIDTPPSALLTLTLEMVAYALLAFAPIVAVVLTLAWAIWYQRHEGHDLDGNNAQNLGQLRS